MTKSESYRKSIKKEVLAGSQNHTSNSIKQLQLLLFYKILVCSVSDVCFGVSPRALFVMNATTAQWSKIKTTRGKSK